MKLGLIGFGYWGKKVFDEYHNLLKEGKIEKLMVFDSNAEVSNFIPSYIKFADSVGEVVENSDLLHVCSPNNTHYELGVKILTEGKHLLMEKPLTTNSDEALKLLDLSKKKGLTFLTGHIYVFSNIIAKVKNLIREKEIGNVEYIDIVWGHIFPNKSSADSGVYFDLLPHPLYILNTLTEMWPTETKIAYPNNLSISRNDIAIVNCRYANGLDTRITVSGVHPVKVRRIEIIGSTGTILCNVLTGEISILNQRSSVKNRTEHLKGNNTILDEISCFINSVETKTICENSGFQGYQVVKIIETIMGGK